MLIIGLVLILASAALGVGAVYDGGESASVEVFGATINTTIGGVFLSGAATMLLFLIGVWLLTSSLGRARRKRAERKEIKRRHRDSVTRLEEERTALRAENERLAEQLGTQPGDAAAAGTGAETARHEAVTDHAATSDRHVTGTDATGSETRLDGTPTERGAHARHEADLRQAEASGTSRSRDGQV
ncbi:MAG: hypothetical protein ACXV2J_04645 [Actinomycetes bacterium]